MSDLKTKPTEQSVEDFLTNIPDERKRNDSFTILEMMRLATGEAPRMWGDAIIGFGDFHYKYASGREGDWFQVGFSPRKANLTLYLGYDVAKYADLLARLGKFKHGKGCLYINKLSDVDQDTLKQLIQRTVETMR